LSRGIEDPRSNVVSIHCRDQNIFIISLYHKPDKITDLQNNKTAKSGQNFAVVIYSAQVYQDSDIYELRSNQDVYGG